MPTIRKPQHVQVGWLYGYLRWQVRSVILHWGTDDTVTLTQHPNQELFSIAARDFTRATLWMGHLRLYRGSRSYWLDLRAPTPKDDGDTVPDPQWWADQLSAVGVPVKVRGANWTSGLVVGLSLAIVLVVGVIAATVTR